MRKFSAEQKGKLAVITHQADSVQFTSEKDSLFVLFPMHSIFSRHFFEFMGKDLLYVSVTERSFLMCINLESDFFKAA